MTPPTPTKRTIRIEVTRHPEGTYEAKVFDPSGEQYAVTASGDCRTTVEACGPYAHYALEECPFDDLFAAQDRRRKAASS